MHEVDFYLGKRLSLLRKKRTFSQSDLSVRLSSSRQLIQKYESGEAKMSMSTLLNISKILNVDISFFIDGINEIECGEALTAGIIPQKRSRPLRILLVEDNTSEGILARNAIEDSKVETDVQSADNGVEAMEKIRHGVKKIDIILLDLNIPIKNGFEVLNEIRKDRELNHIPVIILTNSNSSMEMTKVYQCGASGYVVKSFHPKEFATKLQIVIDYWSVVALPSM